MLVKCLSRLELLSSPDITRASVSDPIEPRERSDTRPAREQDAPAVPARRRILTFVVTFTVLVMAFLIGYRYAMNTEANMRYLFMVASHTTWVLDAVGDEAELEPFREARAAAKRTELAQWRGEARTSDVTEDLVPFGKPLTPLESWLHKAYSKVKNAGSIQNDGPTVRFVAEAGFDERRRRLAKEAQRLAAEAKPEHAERLDAIRSEIESIEKQEDAIPAGPERVNAKRGRQFSFRVVPDCGAVPSMSIFLAAVLAFPTGLWKRLVGAVGGLFVLYWINILRLATLAYIGALDRGSGRDWFGFAHEYLWQGIFIIFVVAVWMAWIEFVVRLRRT